MWQPKQVRIQEQEHARKQEKIAWMKKMYTDAKKSRAQSAVSKTSESSTRIAEEGGDEEEDEDFELLEWAAQLDYEQYLTDWASIASTAHSDAL